LNRAVLAAALLATLTLADSTTLTGTAATRASASRPKYCPTKAHALDGVYHPVRLVIMKACQRATGVIAKIRAIEEDGDLHILYKLDPNYVGLKNDVNDSGSPHGNLIVEFMPRDGGHLPRPKPGDRVTLVGAWVNDTEHGWNELHPVWREILNGTVYTSGPKNGGSPAEDRSANSEADCRDHSHTCTGYRP